MTPTDSGDRRPIGLQPDRDRTDASLPPTEIQAYVAEWRTMEDRFYRAVMGAAELYMLGI